MIHPSSITDIERDAFADFREQPTADDLVPDRVSRAISAEDRAMLDDLFGPSDPRKIAHS